MSLVSTIFFFYRVNLSKDNEKENNNIIELKTATRNLSLSISNELVTHFILPSKLKGRELPFHQIYEPRQVGYPADLQTIKFVNKTKIILLWTPWNGIHKTINYYSLQMGNRFFDKYNCPNTECFTTRNRKHLKKSDAVLFHLLDINSSDLPTDRNAEQIWILYNMEPPWLIRKHMYPQLSKLNNLFNWTMSYRSESDILARYGFIVPQNRITSNRSLISFENKTKNVVWFVSDCITDSKREDYAHELSKYIDVDIYGKCGNFNCYPAQSEICYEEVLQKYKFYLSFENAICKDYVTEKFFNVFNYDIVPIVFGGANYSKIAPEGTFIDATKYLTPKDLAKTLLKIGKNEALYRNILLKKQLFKSYLDPWMCRLCQKLHSGGKNSILVDVEKWWLTESVCQIWQKPGYNNQPAVSY